MREIILCKYGEVALKGANRAHFERMMQNDLMKRLRPVGRFDVYAAQSTIYAEPDESVGAAAFDLAFETAKKTFGFTVVLRAVTCEKDPAAVRSASAEYAKKYMGSFRTFKVEARRADKSYPMISPEICEDVGAAILGVLPIKVDVHTPEQTVYVEIRDRYACISAVRCQGAGGVPLGSAGKGLLLLSGGIDSPVAGYMMARRGIRLDALHFEAFPYTSERAKEKVLELASILTDYINEITVSTVSVRHIQEVLRDVCDEDYFTLLLRRYMMRIAERLADADGDSAIITGESLGQVASQTLPALVVTDCIAARPVFRPLIGSDKEEIVVMARRIGTFETSILPYEDCCTVFTPRHPRTSPTLEKVLEEEAKTDVSALVDEAMQTLKRYHIRHGEKIVQ